MKLHKVALWQSDKMYYILQSRYMLDSFTKDNELRATYLDKQELQERLKKCALVQKQ